jgi:D-alanine-D-alanine ligase-like ATP-grasp enzyme
VIARKRHTVDLPTFDIPPDALPHRAVDWAVYGSIREAQGLTLDEQIPQQAREWVLVYEELLRRMYPECRRWLRRIQLDDVGRIRLNSIETASSRIILQYLQESFPLSRLFDTIRFHRGSPDVIMLIVARDMGLHACRLVDDATAEDFWAVRFSELQKPMDMPTRNSRRAAATTNNAFYVRVVVGNVAHLFFGQATSTTPAVVRDLLGDKGMTANLLRSAGFSVPASVVARDPNSPVTLEVPADASVIVKPVNDGNRVGVVGPIRAADSDLVRTAVERCLSQVSNGPPIALVEHYIHGVHYRVNVNHGIVTFVAKSIPCTVRGDGRSDVRELLNERRRKLGYNFRSADVFFENALLGLRLGLADIPAPGQLLQLSQDGNEEGIFEDATDEINLRIKEESLRLSSYLGCPVLGIDVIVDTEGREWFVDVNTNPGIDFFGDTRRAYDTMRHMLQSAAAMPNNGMQLTALSRRS